MKSLLSKLAVGLLALSMLGSFNVAPARAFPGICDLDGLNLGIEVDTFAGWSAFFADYDVTFVGNVGDTYHIPGYFIYFDGYDVALNATVVYYDSNTGLYGLEGFYDINDCSRINWEGAQSGPVALYCTGDTLEVWDIDSATGEGDQLFTYSDFSGDAPAENTLVASSGEVQLWHLSSGEFQINAYAGEGKTYVFLFNGCPYNGGGYNANLDPSE